MIREATIADVGQLLNLAARLWPDEEVSYLETDFRTKLKSTQFHFIVAEENGTLVGFVEASMRHDYVEGSYSSPVAYIEGIYVIPEMRKVRIGTALIRAVEDWARINGCTEIGSDVELDNELSQEFHRRAGFSEANRLVAFIKSL